MLQFSEREILHVHDALALKPGGRCNICITVDKGYFLTIVWYGSYS